MPNVQCKDIQSIRDLLTHLADDTKIWTRDGFAKPWFRGVTDAACHKLVPSILRGNNKLKEFPLTKKFRLMAPGYGATPDTDRLDQWLFLMQHHRVPTRLLDWTESPLAAAFFAAEKAATLESNNSEIKDDAAIYALDPMSLNKQAGIIDEWGKPSFPVTWTPNSVFQTIKFAFGTQNECVCGPDGKAIQYLQFPVAIYPSTVHARMSSQRGCFTLHGADDRDFESIFSDTPLITEMQFIKYRIPKEYVASVFRELSEIGITHAALFPDFDGLARELRYCFGITS